MAAYTWVGLLSDNWSTPGNWSASPPSVTVPSSIDTVVINNAQPCRVTAASFCLTIDFTGFTSSFRIENGFTLSVYGNAITLGAGMAFTPGTTGILSTNSQAAITIVFAGITIPNLTIGKLTGGGTHAVTVSGPAPTVNRLVTSGVVFITLTGPALTITNSIVLNQRISSGPAIIFLGTVTMSGASLLNTGFTVPALSTLIIGSNVSVAGNITFAPGSILTQGLFIVTISGICTLDSDAVTWYDITVSNPSTSTITLTSNWNISHNLFFNAVASSTGITSAIVRTVAVQGSVTSNVNYISALVLSNITLNLTGTGTFAVARITVGALTTNTININTTNPVGYVIGSSAFIGANDIRLPGLSFNLVGASVASAFVGTTLQLSGTTIDTNRSVDTIGGSNPIYTNININLGTATIITDTTCTGNLIFTTGVSGVTVNGAKILFGGNLVGGGFNVQGTSTLEFTGSNPASWIAGTYLNNIIVNKTGGAVVTAAAGNITWGVANAVLTLNSTVNFSTNSNTFILSGIPLIINNFSPSQFFNMTVPNNGVLNINNNTITILGTLSLLGNATFAGAYGWTTLNFSCIVANSLITLQNIVANPTAEYTVNGLLNLVGTLANRIRLEAAGRATFTGSIAVATSPTLSLMTVSGVTGTIAVGMTVSQATGQIPTGLSPFINDRPIIDNGSSLSWFLNKSLATRVPSPSGTIPLAAGFKAKFTLANNPTSSQVVIYVQTQDIDSNYGKTIQVTGSNGDDAATNQALFRTLNWVPLVATSGSVYYTFIN
jgi:hypothetical protein